ncbi:MAG TPA: M3 family metallopeptidase [Myxococcota bacterium]|nr:M3 family metallopeptidase [Myxococcota bacterium]
MAWLGAASAGDGVEALLAPWEGPFGGLPPFGRFEVADFEPAVKAAMDAQRAELRALVTRKGKPKFEDTIAAFEDSGRALERVLQVYGIWSSTLSTPELREVEERLAPALAAYEDEIYQNRALFDRIDAVYAGGRPHRGWTSEQTRLAWTTWTSFVRAGARLDDASKERLAAINQDLASLYTQFSQHLLADESTWIELGAGDLDGLPPSFVAAAAAAAAQAGLEGRWIVPDTRSFVDPFLTSSTRRDLREKVWRAFVDRGDRGGETDNNAIVTRVLALRAERARLLGYATHAHWRLEDAMAGTPEAAMALMESVWPAAVARVHEEVADMQAVADAEGAKITIEPWDYRFYQEKVRKARYDLDQGEVRAYLQLDHLREGMFWMAGELYGLRFRPLPDVPVYHPDVTAWEVTDAAGAHVGVWYFDPYAREGKRSGAWMNAYRDEERMHGVVSTIVSNNANFVKPAPGEPVLVSWDDAETLFHEFGHALHGLSSRVTYPSLSGTAVARDYVEFPSQLHERWLATPEVLHRFALHAETGAPMPDALIARIEKASTFNQGFATVEYLASALVDMKLHLAGSTPVDPRAFEQETLGALGMPKELVMRHRIPQFGHVFSGDGYSAGYYSYLWADALTADAAEAFEEAGSLYDRATADRLVRCVLSVGNTVDPADGFRCFRGRDVRTEALMRARGFPTGG